MTRRLSVAVALVLIGCGPASPVPAGGSATLPLGDGRVAASPRVGYLDSCDQALAGAGRSTPSAPWIGPGARWTPAAKPTIGGAVSWPLASYAMTVSQRGERRTIVTNGLPVGGTTGRFTPAAQADSTGHPGIGPRPHTIVVPSWPSPRDHPACLPHGPIAVLTNGVLVYDALDDSGQDAVAHELLDSCGGHPDSAGTYHYHAVGSCVVASGWSTGSRLVLAKLVGYAVDGFGVFVERDPSGRPLADHDLDACHGRTSWVDWDGQVIDMYHYVVTAEYPYTVGCLRGAGTGSAWHNH